MTIDAVGATTKGYDPRPHKIRNHRGQQVVAENIRRLIAGSATIPANKTTVITKDFTFDKNVKIVTLFSHTHKLGEKFEILVKPEPSEILVQSIPVKKGGKLSMAKSCKVCFAPTVPVMYDTYTCTPLVLKCIECGCKSWATQ